MAVLVPLLALAVIVVVLALAWPRRRAPADPPQPLPPEAPSRIAEQLRDALDRTSYGDALARDLWAALIRLPPGEGAILHAHRDYCGHGLIRTEAGVMLCEVHDAGHHLGPPIGEWADEAGFTAFLSRQSDFTCSGWDEGEPAFFTADPWARNNQRLTRQKLYRFLDGRPPSGT